MTGRAIRNLAHNSIALLYSEAAQSAQFEEQRWNELVAKLMALQPGELTPTPTTASTEAADAEALKDRTLRISLDEFVPLTQKGGATIVDVRGQDNFAAGHIPGALSIPLSTVEASVEQLRKLGKPIVTYCS